MLAALDRDRAAGLSIGFVPTMGALHTGHLSLITCALKENDRVVCSIFVNPTQFNDPADLVKYPRMAPEDLALLESVGCHYAFFPSVQEMYPQGPQLLGLDLGLMASTMEGEYRPGHFDGVATVVDLLFQKVKANAAYFGEKDFQQLAVIRKMAKLLNHTTRIVGCPTLREDDGLAMSSRNLLLTPPQRKAAPLIYQALYKAASFIPHHTVAGVKDLVVRYIEQNPQLKVQYFEFVEPLSLEIIREWKGHTDVQGCIAVITEGPRLIDNMHYTIH